MGVASHPVSKVSTMRLNPTQLIFIIKLHLSTRRSLTFSILVIANKMAPQMAASVFWCALFCLVLCINSVFTCFTRDELLNIRETTSADYFSTFLCSSVELLDILVKGTLTCIRALKRHRRGKRAGTLVRLRSRGLRTPLPGIFLSNVRSISNKLDELQLLVSRN